MLENKYKKYYFLIIDRAKNRKKESCKYENHHILPKCLGGSRHKSNLVLLTPREHYIVHWLLTKMYDGNDKKKMCHAFWKMNIRVNKEKSHKINSKVFERYRKIQAESMSKMMKGRLVSEEAKESVRESNRKRTGQNHPLYGKKRPEHVNEASRRANLGNKYCLGRILSDESKHKMSESQKNREKFICDICGRQISGSGNLKQHKNSHQNGKI